MTSRIRFAVALAAAFFAPPLVDGLPAQAPPRDYPVQPVPFTAVHLDDVFWAPRIETNRAVTIPFAFKQCELSGRVNNFERAARVLAGQPLENRKAPGYPFDDTDVARQALEARGPARTDARVRPQDAEGQP